MWKRKARARGHQRDPAAGKTALMTGPGDPAPPRHMPPRPGVTFKYRVGKKLTEGFGGLTFPPCHPAAKEAVNKLKER